ncbi:MAG: hypothetical protein JW725_03655, partial [Candidatus Babeliaceae bacterium]|nr:hypothetical protein [Candidatus Babeliaceae bacterium]
MKKILLQWVCVSLLINFFSLPVSPMLGASGQELSPEEFVGLLRLTRAPHPPQQTIETQPVDGGITHACYSFPADLTIAGELSAQKVTTRSGQLGVDSYTLTFPSAVGLPNQLLALDGSGNFQWVTVGTSTNAILNNGNTFGAPVVIGANDPFSLELKTNNTIRLVISSAGLVTIAALGQGVVHSSVAGLLTSGFVDDADINPVSNLADTVTAFLNATPSATPNTLVLRDGSGDFSAHALLLPDQGQLRLYEASGGGTNKINVQAPVLDNDWTLTLPETAGTDGYALTTNGSGVTAWTAIVSPSNAIVQGGNTFGSAVTIGSNDNYGLNLETNNTTRISIANTGTVSVTGDLQVDGDTTLGNAGGDVVTMTAETVNLASGTVVYKPAGTRFLHNYGTDSTFTGQNAGNLTFSGVNNTGYGKEALRDLTTGGYNVGFGCLAGSAITSGESNTCVGNGAALALNAGSSNTAVGNSALAALTSGSHNTAAGDNAAASLTTSGYNVAIGYNAFKQATTGSGNVAVGREAVAGLIASPTAIGDYNVGVGNNALSYVTGTHNVAIGSAAGYKVTSGNYNVAVGGDSLGQSASASTVGSYNTVVGYRAGSRILSGALNVAVGYQSLGASVVSDTTGGGNVGVGGETLKELSSGSGNTVVGGYAGTGVTSGDSNILIGYNTGTVFTTENNNICIGNAGVVADAGYMRIGTSGTHVRCYVSGINGVTPSGSSPYSIVAIDSNGQLGTGGNMSLPADLYLAAAAVIYKPAGSTFIHNHGSLSTFTG